MHVQMKVSGSFDGVIAGEPENVFSTLLEIRELLGQLPVGFKMSEEVLKYAEGAPTSFKGQPVDEVLIEELELGVRAYNCLKRIPVNTIGELLTRSEASLQAVPHFGNKSIDEIVEELAKHGLSLRVDDQSGT